jgi:fructose transport system substrate-binding protein
MQTDLQSKSREDHMKTTTALKTALFAAAAFGALAAAPAQAASHSVGACLITKTDTNPFFVKMKEGAEAKAAELGVSLKSYAGKIDGDHETQVAAIETCIADGAKGILLTASDTSSIVSAVQQARDAGLLVIALDTPLDPIDAADATFATDNFLAGELIGKWAAATSATSSQRQDRHADLAVSQPTVGVLRDQGFLTGFGIDVGIRTSGATRTIRASSATTSPPATRKAAARPWKTCLPRTR